MKNAPLTKSDKFAVNLAASISMQKALNELIDNGKDSVLAKLTLDAIAESISQFVTPAEA